MSSLFRSKPKDDTLEASNSTDPAALEALKSLSGHPGHLSEQQKQALEELRSKLTADKLYTPSQDTQKASHSDATLLRFLRARRFDVSKSVDHFRDVQQWRQKNDVDNLYRTFDVQEMELAKQYYPTFTGRRDKRGIPVYVYRLADLDSSKQKEIAAVPEERRYQRIVALWEYMFQITNLSTALAKEASAAAPANSKPALEAISTVSTIVDLGGVSLSTLWNTRNHLQQASALATANYPETLANVFVVNAPSFFPTAWSWIKGWFDPGTRDKIKVLGNPQRDSTALQALTRFVDKQNLPKQYGGELDWTPGQPPLFDEPAKKWLKDVMGLEELHGPVFIDPDAKAGEGPAAGASNNTTAEATPAAATTESTIAAPPAPAPAQAAT